MKKVLLATTALALTAGVASAEITFSGKGEAGFYRTGKAAENKGTLKSTSKDVTFTSDIALIDHDAAQGADGAIIQRGLKIVTAKANSLDASEHAAAVTAYRAAVKALATAKAGGNTAAIAQAAFDLEVATLDLDGSTAGSAAVKTSDMIAYSGYDMNVAAAGASDNGMTFAMGFDMGAGLIADQDDDRAMDAQGAEVGTSALTIGYAGYTVAIGDDKIDDLYDDTQNGDVSLSGSLGDLTFTVVTDLDDDVKAVAATANTYDVNYQGVTADVVAKTALAKANITDYTAGKAAVAAVYNPTSYAIGYTMGDVAFSMSGTEHDDRGNAAAKMSLTYTVSDALSATVSSDNVGTYKDIGKLSATYKLSDMLTITASVKDDKDHALNTNTAGRQSSDVTVAYSAGAMAASFNTDESSNWWVNAQYDLGGGAQAFTTFDHTEFLVAGVNFAF